ncbi:MAG: hypothetical protein WC532_02890 [Candidatus Omnitrophota bacterium]
MNKKRNKSPKYLNLKELHNINPGFIKKPLTSKGLYVKREKIGYTTGYGFNVGQKGGDEHKNSPKSYTNPVI